MALFFALSLGLAWLLVYLRIRALGERHVLWLPVYRFWVRLFALAYLLSFASSMPVFIQLGSLWPLLLTKIQAISSPILAAILLGALVFKTSLMGLMLFAQRQLADWLHALVVLAVAVGQTLIVFGLIVLVAWMHTPTGVQWHEGQYVVTNWLQVIINPSTGWYATLYYSATAVLSAVAVMAVLAWQALRRPLNEAERRVFKCVLYVGSAAWLGLLIGSVGNGLMVAEHQPLKAAAAMAYWDNTAPPTWALFAWPSASELTNYYMVGVRKAGALWLGLQDDGQLFALKSQAAMTPPVAVVFWSIRIAFLAGIAVLALLIKAWFLAWYKHYDPSALSVVGRRIMVASGLLGPILLVAGLSYQLFGALPFVVNQRITFNEVFAHRTLAQSLGGWLAVNLMYVLLSLGFIYLVAYTVRYGVVSVARHRGRA